ncbi:MAG: UDP-N-acetylglucosamine 2-epimerase (non-hydrolyzing) [Clostridia bacterium]|nr:UDP-N-acetylglucosamine 2-epimerase (non-hydrolyzing) [Clostridia bacterium]MBR3577146.1 UDP-N-acetylglucosamine 2-epimerase (non-hydrolyzing) [Clostridia bacterium]
MNKLKVMTVFGTRPEAIKMAPLVLELEKRDNVESIVCLTAQHREMLDMVMDMFGIKADYDLNIMQQRQTLAGITTKAINGLDEVMAKAQPDVVLVHGDTTTTFAGSVAAFYNKIKVGHVEAGLRTYDKYSPFPEEMNRKLTGSIADFHFSPTLANKNNLLKEAIDENAIYITGNTVIDAIKYTVKDDFKFKDETLAKADFEGKRVILVTAHRRENLGEPLKNICRAVTRLVNEFPDVEVIYPVHLNPAVRETVYEIMSGNARIHLIDPLDVDELHNLMKRCFMVMTDSGGLQEEAPALGKPVLVLRTETERPEAVAAGTAKLAGVEEEDIYNLGKTLLCDKAEYDKMAKAANPYGDGNASARIVDALLYEFGYTDVRPSDM